ncbi:MAG TPA: hypothetical protein PLG43_06540 [Spirochaetia bacterium]|nr:hypothetical protein [Spirochaetia bacterium]
MKRSERILLVCTFLVSFAGMTGAMDLSLSFTDANETPALTIRIIDPPVDRIFEYLDAGMRTELSIEVRIYEQEIRVPRFFKRRQGTKRGMISRLIAETMYVSEARYDPLQKGYLVSFDGETPLLVTEDELKDVLLCRSDIPFACAEGENRYALVRARLRLFKLVPPLTILDNFLPDTNLRTPWKRIPEEASEASL